VCGRVWFGFVGSVCLPCVGGFGVGLWGVSLCCVCERFFDFVGSECVCVCVCWEILVWVCGDCVCAVIWRVGCGFVGGSV